ncbi:MAG: carbohydrate ABC transporter permease [Planctomycetota bacterium]
MSALTERPPWLKSLYYTAALLLILLAAGPAAWLANIALQPKEVETAGATIQYALDDVTLPQHYTLDNARGALQTGNLWRPLVNSVLVTVGQTVCNVVLAALAAYPLARMKFRGRGALFVLILATLMVPEQVIVVPLFVTIIDLGLADTLLAVFLPFTVTAFGIYLCRQAFLSIPDELEEAARLDGASALRIWWHVMLPLARPTLATLAVFSIIGAWSNLLWPIIVLQSEEKFTLPVAISQLLSVFASEIRFAYAASLLALVPMVLMYVVMQRWLTRGILAGAVKG